MWLSIWRHGEAAPGSPDLERRLTARGHSELERGVPAYAMQLEIAHLPAPTAIYTSRWVRTQQTADHLSRHWPKVPVQTMEALIPGQSVAAVEEAVSGLSRGPGDHDNHVLLVSHQPLVGELINHWLGEPHPESAMLPGGFVVLDLPVVAAACATLEFAGSPPNYAIG